ncbi:restriction endonuclease [Streptobacillus moniliformis]|uniref:Eco57I restriction endonuclease n=1 Tax=Streptobacillus moniliformis (strain ATCC 14647 / DSM 12112 / NCTC 10651 / 9901) TaxID=519441 RepID=D1AVX7_STRM9|nr:Eco57I restriction-modification methylase domain-containing protein [Streptobacillus moniliformis]ACZ01887.1 Eco57I restriction endonuclease [Streptobacillus moniliformis DSM 12112]AVL43122.1 restriction endonuclease [Streptobacillus moniliformis]SQA12907.1 Eco57I restriction-modification methylase [Streptobacillus moniliformis]
MKETKIEAIDILDRIIVGRVEPHIYAFTTNTIPNYLKIGDTYRSVTQRLNEWKNFFPDLEKQYECKAVIDNEIYFRDYSVHQFLENDLEKIRLLRSDLDDDIYYSKEFFKDTYPLDIEKAIEDIKDNYIQNTDKYEYYSSNNKLLKTFHYQRGANWNLRPNQLEVVNNFKKAIQNGRKNLLMYAVMRFGKSFTSLCCALEMDANLVLIVSAKADVKDEWKKTLESAGNFYQYVFLDVNDLISNEKIIKDKIIENKKVVLFLTLQDLQGENIKDKHRQLFEEKIDLLIVDETHFGARAESFGKILKDEGYDRSDDKNFKKLSDYSMDIEEANKKIKKINATIRLHLSGTPYRILMGSEFEKEDIISFVQFSDIVKEQEKWDKNNLNNDDVNEWDNPYYGFPQMIRFAFNPNKSSRQKMEALRKKGVSFVFSKLFEPISIKKDSKNNAHKKFQNESEIIDLLKVIDGSQDDENLLGFLDYGKMCKHMVMVLPYCASCDAMEELIIKNKDFFKNLNEYKILNISGVDSNKIYKTPNDIKNKIKEFELENKKTLTLTVNRMLTGSTVEQWDTMIYFKDTSSPQEYDQSIFRLQNQYIKTLSSEKGIIKENLKPQTLLVDFDPNRLFRMQEQKSLIYNVNIEENGNSKLKDRITEELRISPIIVMNNNKISQVEATNILETVSLYNNQRSVSDEVSDIPVDLSILEDDYVRKAIEEQGEFNSKQGLTINPNQGDGNDIDIDDYSDSTYEKENRKDKENQSYREEKTDEEIKRLERQIKTYYQRLLFFSFLTKDNVSSLDDILNVLQKEENTRLAKKLYLNKDVLVKLSSLMDPFKRSKLDYKIQNISRLASDESVNPLDRALTSLKKFNRMSESEVITPTNICEDMVNLFPEDGLREIVNNKNKLLDIASKSGEYTVAIYKRLVDDLGFSHNEVSDIIYSIPTSSIAYEFTRRFYEILNLNVDNIATKFNSYDLIKITSENNEVDYKKVSNLLKQNKKFSYIELTDEIKAGEETVNFGAIVGNPPYQVSDNNSGTGSAKPIYNKFSMISFYLKPKFATLIVPSVWFSGGKGLDEFREYMLGLKGLKQITNFITPQDIFSNVNLRGGINYFLYQDKYDSDNNGIRIINIKDKKIINNQLREKRIKNLEIFISDNIAFNIVYRMVNNGGVQLNENSENMLIKYISVRNPFGFNTKFITTDLFKNNEKEITNPVKIYASKGKIGYVEKDLIKKNFNWINKWKVITPFANNIGKDLQDDNLNTIISEPNSIVTETYLVIGGDLNLDKSSSMNIEKYLKTKFTRFLISIAKANQNGTKITYRFVPIQDFSDKSDIDWSKSIKEIDEQLFDKYELTSTEREHIRSSIKEM